MNGRPTEPQELWPNDEDLAWAKPYLDEARAAVAKGAVISLEEALADIDALLKSLER